jgi:hypothetical protein
MFKIAFLRGLEASKEKSRRNPMRKTGCRRKWNWRLGPGDVPLLPACQRHFDGLQGPVPQLVKVGRADSVAVADLCYGPLPCSSSRTAVSNYTTDHPQLLGGQDTLHQQTPR